MAVDEEGQDDDKLDKLVRLVCHFPSNNKLLGISFQKALWAFWKEKPAKGFGVY